MNGFVWALTAISLVAGAASAQSIEQEALPAPEGAESQTDIDEWTGLPAGFGERASLRPYHNAYGPFPPEVIEEPDAVIQAGTKLRQLDKMTGRIRTLYLPSGSETSLGWLNVRVETCRTRGEDGSGGTISYLRIWDVRLEEQDPIFAGWMFSESPALSALDHPRYDVWVITCIENSGGEPSPSE